MRKSDSFSDNTKKPTETKKTPTRKIDLGASATLVSVSQPPTSPSKSTSSNDDFADFQSSQVTPSPTKTATAMDELADVLSAPLPQPTLLPMNASASSSNNQVDLFGDFNTTGRKHLTLISFSSNNEPCNTFCELILSKDFYNSKNIVLSEYSMLFHTVCPETSIGFCYVAPYVFCPSYATILNIKTVFSAVPRVFLGIPIHVPGPGL